MSLQNNNFEFQLDPIFNYGSDLDLNFENDQMNYPKLRKYNSLFNAVQAQYKQEEEDIFARYFSIESQQAKNIMPERRFDFDQINENQQQQQVQAVENNSVPELDNIIETTSFQNGYENNMYNQQNDYFNQQQNYQPQQYYQNNQYYQNSQNYHYQQYQPNQQQNNNNNYVMSQNSSYDSFPQFNNQKDTKQINKLQQQKLYSNDSNQSSLDSIPSYTTYHSMNKSLNITESVSKSTKKSSSSKRQKQVKLESSLDLDTSILSPSKPVKEKKVSKSSKKTGNNAKKNCAMIRCQKNLWKNFFSIFLKHLDQNFSKIQDKLNKWFPQEDVDIFNHYYQYTLKKQKIFNKAQVLKTFFPVKYQTQNSYFYKSLLIKKILRILAYEFIHSDMFQSILLVSRVKKWEYFIQQKHKLLLTFQTYSQNLE
ncbi:hypothetical protein PPERSA_05948 [Pseudocohnilembus persalinus]|uniref:Uncharacterized protein n=1 Tax=Pseudocohnilembus persalinus TaxID=266149 RepID=A0A0V0R472_PSEPJ|nr:hypothetical protein PPERSA_05948 [Pseudocohnilembus persalinus]|eukprot:KRX09279.1 hypothetical protein PPERSA_05948 [Pseudocohnilembus persalinus]